MPAFDATSLLVSGTDPALTVLALTHASCPPGGWVAWGAGGALALALLVTGAVWLTRRHAAHSGTPVLPTRPTVPQQRVVGPASTGDLTMARVSLTFHNWLAQCADVPDLWAALDQLIREVLTEHLGATRVRCYHVAPGCETLQTVAQHGGNMPAKGPSVREGLLGHVATTGREFVAGDAAHGQLVDDLAANSEETWAWVWPVRDADTTIGIVAVGSLRNPERLGSEVRLTVGRVLSLCWQQVAYREQLRIVRRTDQVSGVLTRGDFFTLAERALADSYSANEPVVVAVLALEGLRRLDDGGAWRERDTLIERLGLALVRRVRTDDLVGRFADDRFILVLRRLDSGLGRLITEKLLVAARDCSAGLETRGVQIEFRAGLAGSGMSQPSLRDLLVAAFNAAERARKQQTSLEMDFADGSAERRDS